MGQVGGSLSVSLDRLAVICQLNKRQDDRYLLNAWGKMTVIRQLHGAGWRSSVSYMRQDDCYLSVTWGRLSVSVSCMRQDDGYLSVT